MKVRDIIEQGYGNNDEPAPGFSKAGQRKMTSSQKNTEKRFTAQGKNANDEFNIAQKGATSNQTRDQKRIPTGAPNRAAYDNMRADVMNARGINPQ